jgi:hypothetical protein
MKRVIAILFILLFAVSIAYAGEPLTSGTITVTGTAQSVSVTNYPGVKSAIFTFEGDNVRVGFYSAPTDSTGHLFYPGDVLELNSAAEIAKFRVIHDSGASGATVEYTLFGTP